MTLRLNELLYRAVNLLRNLSFHVETSYYFHSSMFSLDTLAFDWLQCCHGVLHLSLFSPYFSTSSTNAFETSKVNANEPDKEEPLAMRFKTPKGDGDA